MNSAAETSTRARLLKSLDLVNVAEDSAFLGIAPHAASDELKRLEQNLGLICLERDGKCFYPAFQFDVANARVFPVIKRVNEMRPTAKSSFWLAYWLTRSHVDFGCAPAAVFGQNDDAIVAAFAREIEPQLHA